MFLHRILQLESSDPVNIMFWNVKTLHEAGESNWWSEVSVKLERYKLGSDLDEMKSLSKSVFAKRVRKAIIETAFSELQTTCKSMKKTSDIDYKSFGVQDYLLKLYPLMPKLFSSGGRKH